MTIQVVKLRRGKGAGRPDELRSLAVPALQQRILTAMSRGDAVELEELRTEYRSRSVVRGGPEYQEACEMAANDRSSAPGRSTGQPV